LTDTVIRENPNNQKTKTIPFKKLFFKKKQYDRKVIDIISVCSALVAHYFLPTYKFQYETKFLSN